MKKQYFIIIMILFIQSSWESKAQKVSQENKVINVQDTIANTKIRATKETWTKHNELDRLIYEEYNSQNKKTSYKELDKDNDQILRRSYKYGNKGLLILVEFYNSNNELQYKTEIIYDTNDFITQKRIYSNYSKTISNRELYIYYNDLLIEIRHLDKSSNVYANDVFKYNELKQKIQEINIEKNSIVSKYQYEYNKQNLISKKSEFKKIINNKSDNKETILDEDGYEIIEVLDKDKSSKNKTKEWKEEELYSFESFSYDNNNNIIISKTEGKSNYNGIVKTSYEYDKNNNWIKRIIFRYNKIWRVDTREIEYQ